MLSVCIYCGKNKKKALDSCEVCQQVPESHLDMMHSIIMYYSEDQPYLNFLTLEEIESVRSDILSGKPLNICESVVRNAEEAYTNVQMSRGPKVIEAFQQIIYPGIWLILVLTILSLVFGIL